MEDPQVYFSRVNVALQTQQLETFQKLIKNCNFQLNSLIENTGCSIFHIFASRVINDEEKAIGFMKILIKEYRDRYFEDRIEERAVALNSQRIRDGISPFMAAVISGRNVKII